MIQAVDEVEKTLTFQEASPYLEALTSYQIPKRKASSSIIFQGLNSLLHFKTSALCSKGSQFSHGKVLKPLENGVVSVGVDSRTMGWISPPKGCLQKRKHLYLVLQTARFLMDGTGETPDF